jgi:hypothetical protein
MATGAHNPTQNTADTIDDPADRSHRRRRAVLPFFGIPSRSVCILTTVVTNSPLTPPQWVTRSLKRAVWLSVYVLASLERVRVSRSFHTVWVFLFIHQRRDHMSVCLSHRSGSAVTLHCSVQSQHSPNTHPLQRPTGVVPFYACRSQSPCLRHSLVKCPFKTGTGECLSHGRVRPRPPSGGEGPSEDCLNRRLCTLLWRCVFNLW